MESSPASSLGYVQVAYEGSGGEVKDKGRDQTMLQVDPFLVEALENPRHRLTVLRMELDIQSFMRNPDQHQFEFQHFPTSYLRCAAHRVAQHYGLQTMVLDITLDGSGRIMVWKTPESRFPDVCLSGVPAKQPDGCKTEQVKIVIRPRPSKASHNDADQQGTKQSPVRTVEERKEEYDRARARIFNGSSSLELEGTPSQTQAAADGRNKCFNSDDMEFHKLIEDPLKIGAKDGASRVAAIFRDREKDLTDPDYDRSYDRYVRGVTPSQSFSMDQHNVLQMLQTPSFMHHETGFPQLGRLPRAQASLGYGLPNQIMNPYCPTGCNQTSRDAVYMQWPSPTMMYAQSYGHFRHASFQVPFYQQPLSFERSQKH